MKLATGALLAALGLTIILGASYTARAADEPKPAPAAKAEVVAPATEAAPAD